MATSNAKRDNFRRLAEARTEMVLEALRKLSNLASPNYEYETEEVERVFAAIQAGVDEARKRFISGPGGGRRRFSL